MKPDESERALAHAFAESAPDLRSLPALSEWRLFDGRTWKPTLKAEERDLVGQFLEQRIPGLESAKIARSVLWFAQSNLRLAMIPETFDANPLLLNLENGTLDLSDRTLREHRAEDYITKLAPVRWEPGAECPRWLAFLDRIMAKDSTLISFLQRAVGVSLCGAPTHHKLIVFYGIGRNGKTTFLETVRSMLGSYAKAAAAPTFAVQKSAPGGARDDLARLAGARFVSSSEGEAGARLAEATIKLMTGGDTVTARSLYQRSFEFRPQFTIFYSSNHRPEVSGTDEGIWSRLALVPFRVRIPDDEIDEALPARLREELPGILRWAVEGFEDYQLRGLDPPAAVKDATAEYRNAEDTLGSFLDERCLLQPELKARAGQIHEQYRAWCARNGTEPLPSKALAGQLRDRGLVRKHGEHGWSWRGIGLRAEPADDREHGG